MGKLPGFYSDVNFGLRQLIAEFNGKVDVVENLFVRVVTQTAAVAGGTAVVVNHGLGQVPRGVIVAGIQIGPAAVSAVPGIIYYTDADKTAWSEIQATLRYTVDWTAHQVLLLFF